MEVEHPSGSSESQGAFYWRSAFKFLTIRSLSHHVALDILLQEDTFSVRPLWHGNAFFFYLLVWLLTLRAVPIKSPHLLPEPGGGGLHRELNSTGALWPEPLAVHSSGPAACSVVCVQSAGPTLNRDPCSAPVMGWKWSGGRISSCPSLLLTLPS